MSRAEDFGHEFVVSPSTKSRAAAAGVLCTDEVNEGCFEGTDVFAVLKDTNRTTTILGDPQPTTPTAHLAQGCDAHLHILLATAFQWFGRQLSSSSRFPTFGP